MKKIITIIGCGAVGGAQLHYLVDQLIKDNIAECFEILVFEKSSNLGLGLAYAKDDHHNILNRNAETMSLLHDKSDDFKHWMLNNKKKWENEFTGIKLVKGKESFLPRALFGMYSEDFIQKAIHRARSHHLKVSIICDEVIAIKKYDSNYHLKTKHGWKFNTNIIILALGNLPAYQFGKNDMNERFYSSPYPTKKLTAIPHNGTVGIIGSRLSAIDAAIAFYHQDHTGKIALISRNGFLPAIRSPYRHHELKIFETGLLSDYLFSKKKLYLEQVIFYLTKEVECILNEKVFFKDWINRPLEAKSFLEHEFQFYKTKERIAWQSVLIALNHNISKIWNLLDEKDKIAFNRFCKSKFMAYRIGIPFENAIKIYKLLINNKLSVIKNFKSLKRIGNGFLIHAGSSSIEFDYVIDATGQCANLTLAQSDLIKNMFDGGLIKSNPYGGLTVEFSSSRIIGSDDTIEKNIYAVGNLTCGTYFMTSILESNIKHAHQIANAIALDYLSGNKSSYPINIQYYQPKVVREQRYNKEWA